MDIPRCGYNLVAYGPCREATPEGKQRCTEHGQPQFTVCTGCAGEAIGECPAQLGFGAACRAALCRDCTHRRDATHGPVMAEGAFQNQAPPPSMAPARTARQAMIEILDAALIGAIERGLFGTDVRDLSDEHRRQIAGVLLDELAAEVLMKTLQGMVAGQSQAS